MWGDGHTARLAGGRALVDQQGEVIYLGISLRNPGLLRVLEERRPFRIDLLYGDQQGGQRTVSRYVVLPSGDEGRYAQAGRHWNIDRPDPR